MLINPAFAQEAAATAAAAVDPAAAANPLRIFISVFGYFCCLLFLSDPSSAEKIKRTPDDADERFTRGHDCDFRRYRRQGYSFESGRSFGRNRRRRPGDRRA